MDNIKIKFTLSDKFLKIFNHEKVALELSFENSILTISIFYSFNNRPLSLSAVAALNDNIELCLLPYRIELYVNGRLVDEEWPYGDNFIAEEILPAGFTVSEYIPTKSKMPTLLGSFKNAEGWKPEENIFVGDCMPYVNDGKYHILYLKDRHHHGSKWGLGAHQWNHISTSDFIHWNIHPTAVEIDSPKEGSICTGSWIKNNNLQYLFYTVRTCDGSPAKICRSISTDGYHFFKDRDFAFELNDKYTTPSARDPKLIHGNDGKFHMLLTSSLRKEHSPFGEQRGCLVHLHSDDLENWIEDEPLYISDTVDEPECPDYFACNEKYYLIFSLRSQGNYMYSDKPFSDFKAPTNPIIPCKSVPKMAIWNERIIFSGFDGNGRYAGTLTFTEAFIGENGEMYYKKM